MKIALGGLLLLLALAAPVEAQVASASGCPVGLRLALPGDTLATRLAIDTVYRISVEERRWTLRDVAGAASAGLAGTEPAPWHACAGAWVEVRQAEIVVQRATGEVRVRADLRPLLERLRSARARAPENPGREEIP